jgi:sigma-B regulation protein RsbU (phosphoserine phosphatase)
MKGPNLTFKLTVFFLTGTTLIFFASFYYYHRASKDAVLKVVEENARLLSAATIGQIEAFLRGIEKITLQNAVLIEEHSFDREGIYRLARRTVSDNPEIYGSAIAFQPFAFDPELYYFSPYFCCDNQGQPKLVLLGGEDYDYFSMDWYRQPMDLQRALWSEPYYDKGGGDIIMSTFSAPFYRKVDGERSCQGIITADISLSGLTRMISAIKIYESGYAFLISRNGVVVTHPNEQFIMRENIFNLAEARGDTQALQLGRNMVSGGKGFFPCRTIFSEQKSWIYYAPVPSTGWSLAVVFPEEELFEEQHRLARDVVFIGLAGFVMLFVVIVFIARTIIRPVRQLAVTTEEIARGNLDVELPQPSSNDEIATLTHSFIEMKQALKEYIANLAETTAAKERIESELKIARAIQMSFLPKRFPSFPREEAFEIYAALEPAREIGGDFYDFFLLDEDRLFLAIGDVSGKGIPAALFMAVTKTLIKGIAGSDTELSRVIERTNQELCRDNEAAMFATVFCAILNVISGELCFTNAGHNPPLLIRGNRDIEWLAIPAGIALGVDEAARYRTEMTILEPGASIILYTDGVTEAMNPEYRMYTAERLLATVRSNPIGSSEEIVNRIFQSVNTHASGAPQSDDITAMAVAFRGSGQ